MARINYDGMVGWVCLYCKKKYSPTGPAQKACKVCQGHIESVNGQVVRDMARYRKFKTYDYVGKGFSDKRGEAHHSYKNGIGYFHSVLSKKVKRELRYCQDCGKDLISANRYQWCAHHIDHDRDNNTPENITLLCKRCHQIEHKCWEALGIKGAETISEESTLESVEAHNKREKALKRVIAYADTLPW